MLPFIEAQRAAIAELCRRFHVRRLDVFGSAARGTDFDPSRSDVDLLVSYLPDHLRDFGEYLALRDALSDVLGRPVDLVMEGAVENPFIRAGIERSRQVLYGA
jgi:predicted nucleotidyltransferase